MGQAARIARLSAAADARAKGDPFAYAAENTERGALIAAVSMLRVHAPDSPGVAGFIDRVERLVAPHPALSKEDYHG